MIGQKKNLALIDKWTADNCPQFICIVGQRGSGKKMLALEIIKRLSKIIIPVGIKVDEIREMIMMAQTTKGVYLISDADNMSGNAKNAMLKIVEEPPTGAFFILTVSDESSLLETIKSRAQILRMESYSKQELIEYSRKYTSSSDLDKVIEIANVPQDIDILLEYGTNFFDYVNLVIDNIADVESANAFKSGTKLALKDEPDKYDLYLFWNTFLNLCTKRLSRLPTKEYTDYIKVTCKYINRVSSLGVNKQQLYDMWVLDIRRIKL